MIKVSVDTPVRDAIGTSYTQIASSTAETTIVPGIPGKLLDIYSITITNATATATSVTIKDGTAGATRAVFDLAASGGIVINFDAGMFIPQLAGVGNNWTATLSSGAVTVNFLIAWKKVN